MKPLKQYWSRAPGMFVNKRTGKKMTWFGNSGGPEWSGTVQEWYLGLVESVVDVVHQLTHSKQDEPFVYVNQDVKTILEHSGYLKPSTKGDVLCCLEGKESMIQVVVMPTIKENNVYINVGDREGVVVIMDMDLL